MSLIFRTYRIFADFATSSLSLEIHTGKIRHCYKSLLTALQIAKIGLGEQLTDLLVVIFTKIARHENIPIYGIALYMTVGGRYASLQKLL